MGHPKKGRKKSPKKVIEADENVEFVCTLQPVAVEENVVYIEEPFQAHEVPEQAKPNNVPGEQHNAEEPKGEVELCTDQEHVVGRSRKRKRGPTRMKDLAKDPNTRIYVDFNLLGEPYGDGSMKLFSYLGPLARFEIDDGYQRDALLKYMGALWIIQVTPSHSN
ncbi:hypothetical protein BRARA_J00750 [Brassica rapa]|uniref:Uncharacterized protein n=1 Tax=Brassica campestris TaxID=3711 RepID=A0A397XIX3_BRACM|nr:hypothetical protein BRARA_J00750 [Brassica rapa]